MAARCSMRAGHRGARGGWEIGAPETSPARQELPNEVRASREPGSVKILRLLSLQHDAHGEPRPRAKRLCRDIARPAGNSPQATLMSRTLGALHHQAAR